jgi:predicted secreted protein
VDEVVSADASGRFSVELEEPAASGYSWTPAALPPGVQLEGDEVTPAEAVLGGARRHVFRFVASQAGRHQLDFELKRSWEEEARESRRVQVQVGA